MGVIRKIMVKMWTDLKPVDAERVLKQPAAPRVRRESCIPYAKDNHPLHQLNLYYPDTFTGKLPVIIDIHGGGMMYGDKELNQRYCEYLASKGFCVMGMSYRLLPETDLKGMVQDVFDSMHWLDQCGERRDIDFQNVFLTGDSAGGYLASLVMCIQTSEKLQHIYDVTPVKFGFRAAAISNGVCEIRDYYAYPAALNKRIDRELIRMVLGKDGAKATWNGYYNFSDVLPEAQSIPPTMVIGAENDPFFHQTCTLIKNLDKHNCPKEILIWKKEDGVHLGHVFHVMHWEWMESKVTNDKMLDFFRGFIK